MTFFSGGCEQVWIMSIPSLVITDICLLASWSIFVMMLRQIQSRIGYFIFKELIAMAASYRTTATVGLRQEFTSLDVYKTNS